MEGNDSRQNHSQYHAHAEFLNTLEDDAPDQFTAIRSPAY